MDRRSLLLAMGSAALTGCAAGRRQGAKLPAISTLSLSAELDELIPTAMLRLGAVAGISVAVYSPEGRYTRGFGVADIGLGDAVTPHTCFYIASATKPLTALALASLSDAGAFDLDSTLSAFSAAAPFPASVTPGRVTIRNLLSHASGIRCDPIAVRLAFSGEHSPERLWQLLGACEVNADAPFGVFGYTNTGYNIATILTDRGLGQPWQDMLAQQLFRPSGMSRAVARVSSASGRGWQISRPHAFLPNGISKLYLEKTDRTMQSAGGVFMSADDAVRWLELMAELGKVNGRRIVSERALLATRSPLVKLSSEFAGYSRRGYGMGWYHVPFRDEDMLHHFGSFAGARAHVSYVPARRVGIAIFANDSTVGAPLIDAIADFVYDRTAGRTDARSTFNARVMSLVTDRDRYAERIAADRARRAAREWKLPRGFAGYAGRYRDEAFGDIEIHASAKGLDVAFGVMHAAAEPGAEADVIRVELVPGSGERISFVDSPQPALVYNGATYTRT